MKLKRALCSFFVGGFTLFWACSHILTLSGPGSETTNGMVVAGIAELPDGSPASGANIFIKSVAFLPDTLFVSAVVIPDTVASSDGSFSCVVPDSVGEYAIEINYQNKYASLIRFNPLTTRNFGSVTLPQTAGFHGVMDLQGIASGDNIYVQIYGSHRMSKVDAYGTFSFLGMPSGRHLVRVFSNISAYGVIDKDTVELFPAENRNMGTYIMPFNAWKDTVVVRAILDSNGLDAVKVADVTAVNNNQRIVSLNLIGYGITTVPSAVAKLRLRHLKLGENKLTAIPEEIGLIAPLTDLGLKLNALAAIPTTLGNLIHLTDLNLSNNSLSTLPVELTNMTQLQALSVDYNHLTVVTDPVLTWLNTYSNNTAWASTQQ